MTAPSPGPDAAAGQGRPLEVFRVFLALGLRAFGGPVAHLGHFHEVFVRRRRWVEESLFGHLVALSQLLPGPASSQVGMAIGMLRAGIPGMIAAWLGFTLPSALLMTGFGYALGLFDLARAGPVLRGLQIAALAVVARALLAMAAGFCRGLPELALALAGGLVAHLEAGPAGQIAAILLGALCGLLLFAPAQVAAVAERPPSAGRLPWLAALLFLLLLFALPLAARLAEGGALTLFAGFYRAGALIFGGGHVVLPLLERVVVPPGWVQADLFLAGYGAAQALPGPLLSFAAYLGTVARGSAGWPWAVLALGAIFLPSLLLVAAALPHLARLRGERRVAGALRGVNAAVVGLLGAALYDPVWTHAVTGPASLLLAAAGLLLLWRFALPSWVLVVVCAAAGALLPL